MSHILVLGGTGSIGRPVVARLTDLGDQPRVLTRNPDRARRNLPEGTEVVAGDLTDPASIVAALDGIDAVVMTHDARTASVTTPTSTTAPYRRCWRRWTVAWSRWR